MEIAMSENGEVEDDGSVEITLEDTESTETPVVKKVEVSSGDTDLQDHSESVRKRIDKLTYRVREAERREQAALEFAKGLKGQLDTYQERAHVLDRTLVNEFDNRLKTQEKMVKDELRRAIDEGNVDAQITAQTALANLAVENDKLRQSKNRRDNEDRQRAAIQAAPPPRVEQQAPRPDPKAQSWAERNEWFGSDKAMTATAYAIHADLVEAEGFDPTSDDYYQELDSRIRNEFPHKFKAAQGNTRPQSAVASARTTVKSSNNKVKLSESQIRVAKSLGVSLEEYARHARIQQQG
jgi:hypothetical protein